MKKNKNIPLNLKEQINSRIGLICSMLLKLKAAIAYFPAIAFLNISLVFTSPKSL